MSPDDALNNAPIKEAIQAAYQMITAIQSHPAHIQCAAVAILFREVCAVHRVDGRGVLNVAAHMARAAHDDHNAEYSALQLYAKHELRNGK